MPLYPRLKCLFHVHISRKYHSYDLVTSTSIPVFAFNLTTFTECQMLFFFSSSFTFDTLIHNHVRLLCRRCNCYIQEMVWEVVMSTNLLLGFSFSIRICTNIRWKKWLIMSLLKRQLLLYLQMKQFETGWRVARWRNDNYTQD